MFKLLVIVNVETTDTVFIMTEISYIHIYDSLYFAIRSYVNLTSIEQNYIKKRYPNLNKNNVILEKVTK